jgi:hypothetical protein
VPTMTHVPKQIAGSANGCSTHQITAINPEQNQEKGA